MAEDPELRLAYLGAVVEASNDAIVAKALDGTITSWNASAERIFGYRSEEILGKNIRTLIPADLQDEGDEILARIRAGDYIEHYETLRLAKDGRRLDVSLSTSPIKNRAGEVIGASKIARDISARKLAEEQLLAATAKFEAVFSQSGIFAGILDLDGNLREVNAHAVDSYGYTREEVLDRPFWSTCWWRGSRVVQDRIREAARLAAQGEVFRATLPYWTGDGSERLFDFAVPDPRWVGNGAVLYPTGIDITERAQPTRYGPRGRRTPNRARASARALRKTRGLGRRFRRCSLRAGSTTLESAETVRRLRFEWFRRSPSVTSSDTVSPPPRWVSSDPPLPRSLRRSPGRGFRG
jgi:PAS domain S-box-containing protein